MKAFISIILYLTTIVCYCQNIALNQNDSIISEFEGSDSVIQCKNCKIDVCGNIYNNKGILVDIIPPRYSPPFTFYFTTDTILLDKTTFEQLIKSNKVNSISKSGCTINKKIFGQLGINEIIFIEIKDTTISSTPLLTLLKSQKSSNPLNKIRINGYETICKNIRYHRIEDFSIKLDTEKKFYDIEIK